MFRHTRTWLPYATVLVVGVGLSSTASAGWVTLRNDSRQGLVIQEVVRAADGSVKRGRPTRLLPGETLREFRAGPMTKWVEVFDMQARGKPLFSGRLSWKEDSQAFSITANGKTAAITPVGPVGGGRDILPISLPPPKKQP